MAQNCSQEDEQSHDMHGVSAWALMVVMGGQGMVAELDQSMVFSDVVCIPNKAGFGMAVTLCRSSQLRVSLERV